MVRGIAPLLGLVACTLAGACASSTIAADTGAIPAEGVFVRHVRVRVAPPQTPDFEALVARCEAAARSADLPVEYEWLCYREPPGRYWLLWFSATEDGFALPDEPDVLTGLVRHLMAAQGEEALADAERQLAGIDHEIEWNVVHRQRWDWGTARQMTNDGHPVARMMVRTVVPGSEAAFDRALAARTAFLQDMGYPLPIRGFVTLSGAPGTAMQVAFGLDWPSFHARDSFGAFGRDLDEASREEYLQYKRALLVTMSRAEYYDGQFAPELCYGVGR